MEVVYQSPWKAGWPGGTPARGPARATPTRKNWTMVLTCNTERYCYGTVGTLRGMSETLLIMVGWTWAVGAATSRYFLRVNWKEGFVPVGEVRQDQQGGEGPYRGRDAHVPDVEAGIDEQDVPGDHQAGQRGRDGAHVGQAGGRRGET